MLGGILSYKLGFGRSAAIVGLTQLLVGTVYLLLQVIGLKAKPKNNESDHMERAELLQQQY